MIEYLPTPNYLGANVKVELDLPNYVTETDLKNTIGADTSSFDKKTDLAHLKSDVDKLDIDKLKKVPSNLSDWKSKVRKFDVDKLVLSPVDLSKLCDPVKNDVIKKTKYHELVKNGNNISTADTRNLV